MLNESVEVDIVLWFQNLGSWLEWPMKFFTALGIPIFYVVVVPLLYWLGAQRVALRAGVFLFAGGVLNDIAKVVVKGPRPFWVSPDIETFGQASGAFGMPSGHSQVAAPAWALIVGSVRRPGFKALGVAVAALIALSRVYLGVHSLSQVMIGLVVGGLLLLAMLRYEQQVVDRYRSLPLGRQLGVVGGLTALGALVGYAVTKANGSWEVPVDWAANFATATSGEEHLDPVHDTGFGGSLGSLAGTLLGVTLQERFVRWRADRSPLRTALRIPIGVIAMSVPSGITSAAFEFADVATDEGSGAVVFNFALTFALFFGVFFIAPWAFSRLLREREKPEALVSSH